MNPTSRDLNQITKTFKQLVAEFLQAKQNLERHDAAEKPIPPVEPDVFTMQEWKEFTERLSAYQSAVDGHQIQRNALINAWRESEIALSKQIPVSHKWFLTNDQKFAVSRQESNWGGHSYAIVVVEDPVIADLPKLGYTYYN